MLRVERWGLEFTYYEQSGGVIVSRHGLPIDAGLIREPYTPLSERELVDWSDEWFHRDNMTVQRDAVIKRRKGSK